MDQAISVLTEKPIVLNAEEAFGRHVALSLLNIADRQSREFAKLKVQEILFQAQFDMLGMPMR